MSYKFPADISDRLQSRLSEGGYQSEDDVIRHAMDALDQLEQEKLIRWHERNQRSSQESQQGLSRPLDERRVLDRLRERLAAEGIVE